MITDNQAREAIKTIAKYCSQQTGKNGQMPCIFCTLYNFCFRLQERIVPGNWTEYIDRKNEEEAKE